MNDTEQFTWIKNFEGRYSISNHGRVFSHLTGAFRVPVFTNRITSGGRQVKLNLCKANRTKTFRLKRLVAEAFIPNLDNKPCIIHINGNPQDCRASNLRYATRKETFEHVFSDTEKMTNYRNGAIKSHSKPVINDLTGLKYQSGSAAEQLLGLSQGFVTSQIQGKAYKNNNKCQFRYI